MHPFTRFRKEHQPRMTKADLGRMLGVSRSYIHRIEMGEREVGIPLLNRVRKHLGLPPEVVRPDLKELLK